ncbi:MULTISPECIES: DNA-binding protein [Streptomyces violaceusniger group]|uniref:DNA-binding protein n=1 Tax=Streptomyces violaceusniger group TaxID=2839105 RepID=UPI0027DEB1D5|nr:MULTISPECIES: DNA-binding protein [Streptomyces violaceusniger group]
MAAAHRAESYFRAAQRLQLDRSAVYDLLRTRQLASITLGLNRLIPAYALADFIHTHLDQEAAC